MNCYFILATDPLAALQHALAAAKATGGELTRFDWEPSLTLLRFTFRGVTQDKAEDKRGALEKSLKAHHEIRASWTDSA